LLYGEVLGGYSDFGAAAGWNMNPIAGGQGPQVTLFAHGLALRAVRHGSGDTTFSLTLTIGGDMTWVWSR
jgi:hypothetical protein